MIQRVPHVGDVYRHELLGSAATYRIVAVDGDHVRVEVVEAPGLMPGHRLRLTMSGLEAMQRAVVGTELTPPSAGRVERADAEPAERLSQTPPPPAAP